MVDRLLELQSSVEMVQLLVALVAGPIIGAFFLGRALSVRWAMATFAIGTAIVAFLVYSAHQSHVDYCKDSPEVAAGGDPLSCLEPGNWFAYNLEQAAFLLAQIGLVTVLASSVVNWLRTRRPPLQAPPGAPSSTPSG